VGVRGGALTAAAKTGDTIARLRAGAAGTAGETRHRITVEYVRAPECGPGRGIPEE